MMRQMEEVPSVGAWRTNGELIAAVARLGWLDGSVLDVTYGHGKFWTEFQPDVFTGCDLNPAKSPVGYRVDFTRMPFADRSHDVVVFDPPYKLSGTPALDEFDERYGIDVPAGWRERMALILAGAAECARVADRHVLVKCQDQVVSGAMRWQSRAIADVMQARGFRQADRFEYGATRAGRPQPSGRRQVHARHHASQLLVFTRGRADNGVPAEGYDRPGTYGV